MAPGGRKQTNSLQSDPLVTAISLVLSTWFYSNRCTVKTYLCFGRCGSVLPTWCRGVGSWGLNWFLRVAAIWCALALSAVLFPNPYLAFSYAFGWFFTGREQRTARRSELGSTVASRSSLPSAWEWVGRSRWRTVQSGCRWPSPGERGGGTRRQSQLKRSRAVRPLGQIRGFVPAQRTWDLPPCPVGSSPAR